MKWRPPSTKRPHPESGRVTQVWTRRAAAEVLGVQRGVLEVLCDTGVIPEPVYGYYGRPGMRSPLWSERQIILLDTVLHRIKVSGACQDASTFRIAEGTATRMKRYWNVKAERDGRVDRPIRGRNGA